MKIPETVILIVEDESVIAETIIFALESEGLKTKWVATGQDALAYISQSTPNLVILDVGLPDQSGFEVCKKFNWVVAYTNPITIDKNLNLIVE